MDDLNARFAKPEKLKPLFVNMVKKIVKIKATSYLEPPKRELMDAEGRDRDILAEILEGSALNSKMKMTSRLVKLLKTVMVRPVWRNGRLDLDVLTPDLLDVETGNCPEDVKSVMVTHYVPEKKEVWYERVTPSTMKTLDYRGRVLSEQRNPYGVIPFIPMWDEPPVDQFFIESGDDLIVAQDALNVLLTSLVYTNEMQGYAVGYVKSDNPESEIVVGPGVMAELEKDGEIGFVSPNAPIGEVRKSVEFVLKQTAIANGLSASSLSTDPTKETGISRVVGNRELMEQRADEIELFRVYERRLFDVMRLVWNHHNPSRKLSTKARLKVDFADLKESSSLTEQIAAWESLLSMGVISEVDIIMERNPDLKTREEAAEFLGKVQAERGQLVGVPDEETKPYVA
ncbi:MAG: hypothetical protein H0S80_05065 [Desulfovibrionaceae bacterium]|nr:hypothetical protein [Desulfovibrionaceae bacterium]